MESAEYLKVRWASRRRLRHERERWVTGERHVAGLDEAGRGPLAGPVVAAAVVFAPGEYVEGVRDSKLLTPAEREALFGEISARALGVGVGVVDHETIDRINILQATFRAMHEAVERLPVRPDHLLVDGNRFLDCGVPFTTVVDGDALSFTIAAASVIAKVTRDRLMVAYDAAYPLYGFVRHKGYATPEHRRAIAEHGLCPIHRRSFTLDTQIPLPFRG